MTRMSVMFEELLQEVARLARPMGFEDASRRLSVQPTEPPLDSRLLESSYALLCICPATAETLKALYHSAAYWLDDQLREHENDGRAMDGYLLLALDAPPSPETRNQVRQIEQDPSFCRKHVLWPDDGSWECRLERVTVLALAKSPNPAEPATIPSLREHAENAWDLYQKEGDNVSAVERYILNKVGLGDSEVRDDEN